MEAYSVYDLERRIDERADASPDVSYTRKLLDRGVAQCAKKLGEEAVELALASVTESRERLIEDRPPVLRVRRRDKRVGDGFDGPFAGPPPGTHPVCLPRSSQRDTVQPAGDGSALADGAGLPGEDQEDGLKAVFRIVVVAQQPPADAPDHPAVALN